jgi:hypothetical protein
MSQLIVGVIFAVGMYSMLLYVLSIYKENLTKSQKETVKIIGGILIVFGVANLGNVLGLWG